MPDGLTLLDEHPNVVVLRTFSKAYGLAGLRVGYAIACRRRRSPPALRQTQVPFAVSSVAQEAALASLEPEAEAQLAGAGGRRSSRERGRVLAALIEIGYAVPPSQGNFVWLPLGDDTVAWAAGCEAQA